MLVRPLQIHVDVRGSFMETYRHEWLPPGSRGMVQSNLSRSKAGVLRGLHFHRQQADYWVVLDGRMFVGLLDLRPGTGAEVSPQQQIVLDSTEPQGLYIPPGVAHGFYAETDVVFQYMVDAYYDGADEFGIAWDDPDLGISWPTAEPILSDRDRANPSLAQVLADRPVG